jgi:hypothetical protein
MSASNVPYDANEFAGKRILVTGGSKGTATRPSRMFHPIVKYSSLRPRTTMEARVVSVIPCMPCRLTRYSSLDLSS